MNKKKALDTSILATLLLIAFICLVCLLAYDRLDRRATGSCFQTLDDAAEQAVISIQSCISGNQEQLAVIADLLAQDDAFDAGSILKNLSSFHQRGTLAGLGLLLPSGEMLLSDPGGMAPEGAFSYSAELARAPHISGALPVHDPGKNEIFYQSVPVQRDGQTLGILFGFVSLEAFADSLCVTAYDGNVQFYVADGENGDFLVDTWHKTLGNIYDESMMRRKAKRGYDFAQMKQDFAEGTAGHIAFWSNTAGDYFYSCYLPVGINRWMMQLTVLEPVVFEDLLYFRRTLLLVAGVEVLAFAAYFMWVLLRVRRETAQTMYMYDVQQTLFGAHKLPELFVSALQKVASKLSAQTAFFLVLQGGAIRECFFSSEDDGHARDFQALKQRFPQAYTHLCAGRSLLLYAGDEREGQMCAGLARLGIESLMLAPVLGPDGTLSGILGCTNMRHRWRDSVLLECVARNFLMAQSNMEFHRRIRQLSMTDALTGLGNRHSFEHLTHVLAAGPLQSLLCLYMDANGLHELNNTCGHAAGDAMLRCISDALRRQFPVERCFRIGGDEFVVFCDSLEKGEAFRRVAQVRAGLEEKGYSISIGLAWGNEADGVHGIITAAEKRMYEEKQAYYRKSGKRLRARLDDRNASGAQPE